MKYLVTGAAGFIGSFVAEKLCNEGYEVVGIDNLNDYYDPQLKLARLKRLKNLSNFHFMKMDLSDRISIAELFATQKFNRVIHLAAQAGVRYSIDNPMAYVDSNLVGMATILEGCRHNAVEHLIYASSSSVYGMNKKIPFTEDDRVDNPVSLYAATKKANELMAHTYSHLYQLPATGLRFFTVYGPWGRPDMAPYLFTDAISNGKTINVFNYGKMQRDFTYIDDIVESIFRIQNIIPNKKSGYNTLYNIGNSHPVELSHFIECIEDSLGIKANCNYMPMQPGDVETTYADCGKLEQITGYTPNTPLSEGINKFVEWFREYNKYE
ncbi:NAD-dependent epimerase [Vibrio salinus]|uniref:NAD-dependent epimerase n=1 Tax=Vibrio salinus TaxID=2899784 RepID=UPI001E42A1DB|nr:NAD-dependent epimerase [Vibrio salinus]MCE0493290.1 NAD-dependent epimerase [Vibrio salinus]